jgi:hypothetical protein
MDGAKQTTVMLLDPNDRTEVLRLARDIAERLGNAVTVKDWDGAEVASFPARSRRTR